VEIRSSGHKKNRRGHSEDDPAEMLILLQRALLFDSEKTATRNRIFLVFANVEEEFIYITHKGRWNNIGRALALGRDCIIDLRPIFQRK
jgi:hypothetical protein